MKLWNFIAVMGLTIMTASCGYSKNYQQPMAGNLPAIVQLMPNSAASGSGSFVMTVNGNGFNANAAVNWNGMALTTTYISTGQLTAKVPASDVVSSGTAQITVTNPGVAGGMYGGGTMPETSAEVPFTIN